MVFILIIFCFKLEKTAGASMQIAQIKNYLYPPLTYSIKTIPFASSLALSSLLATRCALECPIRDLASGSIRGALYSLTIKPIALVSTLLSDDIKNFCMRTPSQEIEHLAYRAYLLFDRGFFAENASSSKKLN